VFVFSLTIVVTGVLVVRNRKYLRRLKQLFRSEPNTGLPNFQALQMDIRKHATECLCYIRCTELNTLEQTHGIEFRFEFVKALSSYVRKLIKDTGNIYYAPGHGIILRLNTVPDIPTLYKDLNSFRFIWKDYQLGLSCGVAYTTEKT
jgi:GGDEF domain-containing protein